MITAIFVAEKLLLRLSPEGRLRAPHFPIHGGRKRAFPDNGYFCAGVLSLIMVIFVQACFP